MTAGYVPLAPRAVPRRALPVLGAAVQPLPKSVRISVTDRCDFACTYCRPSRSDGYAEQRLSREGWRAMFRGLREAGITRVRLPGGEPLISPDILGVVAELAAMGFEDLALTT